MAFASEGVLPPRSRRSLSEVRMLPALFRPAFIAAAAIAALLSTTAGAQVEKPAIKFSQGWLFQATQAQFPLAAEKGYWKSEGLEVTVDRGSGSATSIQRVASGTHDIAYSDVGTIVKWNAENPGRELMIFYVAEDGFPLVAVSLKTKGISKPKDLEGKKLGAPSFDGGRQMFPAFAKANGIDQGKIAWTTMDANLREQMLVKGDVDVITGFITSAVPTLNGLGVKTADLSVMKYDDYNLDGFGNAVFATRDFVEKNPKTVMAFVKGLNRAMKEMIADPKGAIAAIKGRDPLINADLEADRLKLYVKELLLTKNVKDNGFSAVDVKKMERQIASVMDAFNVKANVTVASVYTEKFLPSKADRIPPAFKE
jgi:NitT/TauT family transport system substrate-binding protein